MSDATTPTRAEQHGERIVRLEQIADDTRRTLDAFRAEMTALRAEMNGLRAEMAAFRSDTAAEFRDVRNANRTQFYWTLACFAALLGAIAKGFGWLH